MTVVASCIYRDGKRAEEVALADEPFATEENAFVWIGLTEPTEEEIAAVEGRL